MTWRKYDPAFPPKAGQRARCDGGAEQVVHQDSDLNKGSSAVYKIEKWEIWEEPASLPKVGDTVRIPKWCGQTDWVDAIGKVVSVEPAAYGPSHGYAHIEWQTPKPTTGPILTNQWSFPNSNIVIDNRSKPAPKLLFRKGDRVCHIDLSDRKSHGIEWVGTIVKDVPVGTKEAIIRYDHYESYRSPTDNHSHYIKELVKQFSVGDRVEWTDSPDKEHWVGTVVAVPNDGSTVASVRYDHYEYGSPSQKHVHTFNTLNRIDPSQESYKMGTKVVVGQLWKSEEYSGYTVKIIKIHNSAADVEVIEPGSSGQKKGSIIKGFGYVDTKNECAWGSFKPMPIKVETGQIWETKEGWKVKITKVCDGHVEAENIGTGGGYADGNHHRVFSYINDDGFWQGSMERWTMIENIKKEGNTMSKDKEETKKDGFGVMFKQDFADAAWRSGATQVTNAVQTGILAMLKDKGMEESKLTVARELLETDFGKILIRAALGYGLTYAPVIGEDPRAVKLAKELRVGAMGEGMDQVAGVALQYLMPAVTQAIAALPPIESAIPGLKGKKRVAAAADVEEDEEETVEEKKSSTASAG